MHDDRPVMVWITTGYPPEISGTASAHEDRARWFARNGSFRVVVLAPAWEGVGSTPADDESPQVIRYPSKPWPPFPDFRAPTASAARRIEAVIAQLKPALIVHADVERAFMFATWRLLGRRWARRNNVPYLAYYHTDFYNFARTYPVWRLLRRPVIRPTMRMLYSAVDAAICPSPSAAAQAAAFGAPRSYALRLDGVDTSRFRPDRRDPEFVARLLDRTGPRREGAPGPAPRPVPGRVVLSLGRLAREKRVDLIIEAVGRAQREPGLADLSLVVAGSGAADTEAELRAAARGTPRPEQIHFIGPVRGEEKATLVASCDALCLASPFETFGVTATEAMASGLTVVAPRGGALADYLRHQENSYLYRPLDASSLAATLVEALRADRGPVVGQALADVQQFASDRMTARLDRFLAAIVRDKELPDSIAHYDQLSPMP